MIYPLEGYKKVCATFDKLTLHRYSFQIEHS